MNKIKCECGHVNPHGTVLCEACGKPVEGNQHIDGNENSKLLNMRYEGSARRSNTYKKSIIDKIWNFFSSVKVGVWLIVLTLIASAIGTIFPQDDLKQSQLPAEQFYPETYGVPGKIYYQLGFHHLYSSWWYLLLLALIGVSLVICSIDRVVPLYRALKKQRPRRHESFLKRQRLFGETENVSKDELEKVRKHLKDQRYKLTEEEGYILAEKGRFSRWGPYVNHIGLIIILLAAVLRSIPFMYEEDSLWVREGETAVVPGTEGQYYIKNKEFTLETYDKDDPRYKAAIQKEGGVVPKLYKTEAVIYKADGEVIPGVEPKLKKIKEGEIIVNEPLKFDGYALYQSSFQLNEFKTMSFSLNKKDSEEAIDTFKVDLTNPKSTYELKDGYRVVIDKYLPEFYMDNGEPRSKSKYPRKPAFVFFVYPPGAEEPEKSFLTIGTNLDPTQKNEYKLNLAGIEMRDVTGLTMKRDFTLPFFIFGALIFMIGVIQGMYWNHRRIWIHPTNKGVWISGHTNKNWFGLKRDIEKVIADTSITMPKDQQELQ